MSQLRRRVQQTKALTIFHPEDEAGFFADVLDLSQVVADEAVKIVSLAESNSNSY